MPWYWWMKCYIIVWFVREISKSLERVDHLSRIDIQPTTVFHYMIYKKQVSMIRRHHNHTPKTNPRRLEEEPQNTDCHKKSGRLLRGYIFQKLLLAWKFSCIYKNCFFVKETDTFGHIIVWTTYTSHIDHFTPQHTAFEQSAACLSVFLELLPGLIPLTMMRHTGRTLEKTICMNMTYNYSTTIFRIGVGIRAS